MKNIFTQSVSILALATGLAALSGCTAVTSTMPSVNSATGEAWYTESTGFFNLVWGSRVWYCPAAKSSGPVTCVEAKMVDADNEGSASAATTGITASADPAPVATPTPAPASDADPPKKKKK